jgi:hypothetical protein
MNTPEHSSVQKKKSKILANSASACARIMLRQYQGLSKSISNPAPTFAEIGSSSGSMLKKSDGMSKSLKSGMANATS